MVLGAVVVVLGGVEAAAEGDLAEALRADVPLRKTVSVRSGYSGEGS